MTEFVRIVSLCLTIHSHDLKLSNNVTELLLPGPSFPPIFSPSPYSFICNTTRNNRNVNIVLAVFSAYTEIR